MYGASYDEFLEKKAQQIVKLTVKDLEQLKVELIEKIKILGG